ncbi:DUF4184 family protein [Acinetobacter sp. MB5]|uniref:DUF4184 family protein n=1 Tax=Acinetobacter sp. MB5 TaxID=2069438 RepID=UPI000DD05EB6|nr:DUF4184 family protein [Acinetobacter sp. MB5]
MAFTVSHMLIAPVIYRLSQRKFPLAAAAIGCMAPDLIRLFTQKDVMLSHLWQGLIFPDLLIGLIASGLWYLLYRPVIFTGLGLIAPLGLQSFKQYLIFFIASVCALLLGTISHFIWDSFTHVDARTWLACDFLEQSIELFDHHFPMHRLLQIGTSVLALPWLWIWTKHYIAHYRQATPTTLQRQFLQRLSISALLCGMAMLSFYLFNHAELGGNLYELSGRGFKAFVQGWLVCFTAGSGLFLWKYSQIQAAKKSLPPS